MSHQVNNDDEALSEVNVIPLADLSLVLLIILMVLSPMITQAIFQVKAADAQRAQSQEELATPETPVIVSYAPGKLKLNGIEMNSESEFVKRLSGVLLNRRDKSVILTASPDMVHGRVVHVMDLIKRQGASGLVMVKWSGGATAS